MKGQDIGPILKKRNSIPSGTDGKGDGKGDRSIFPTLIPAPGSEGS